MQILILGAGQVGGILADSLAKERFDVTLVDKDPSRLKAVGERLDIKTIHGEASHPDVLRRAGAEEADILVAATGSCLLYTSPSPRDLSTSRMPSSA